MADIVVGVDGSTAAEQALRWAVQEAQLRDATVRAVLAWAPAGPTRERSRQPPATSPEHPRWAAQELLGGVVERVCQQDPATLVFERVVFAAPVETLLAESERALMLVVGIRELSGRRMLTGSVSLACAYGARVPVVVVHGGTRTGTGRSPVVVGVDGSAASRVALRWAAGEALLRQAPLRVVHAWEPLPPSYMDHLGLGEAALEDAAQAELAACVRTGLGDHRDRDLDVEAGLVRGSAARGLVDAGSSAQLLVVGARGRGGFEELMIGSTSSQCVLHAPCPVAVVRDLAGCGS